MLYSLNFHKFVKLIIVCTLIFEGTLIYYFASGIALLYTAYAFGVTFGILKVLDMFHPVRVSENEEIEGLDRALHGEDAYEFLID